LPSKGNGMAALAACAAARLPFQAIAILSPNESAHPLCGKQNRLAGVDQRRFKGFGKTGAVIFLQGAKYYEESSNARRLPIWSAKLPWTSTKDAVIRPRERACQGHSLQPPMPLRPAFRARLRRPCWQLGEKRR